MAGRILILGAGPTGIGAALRLQELKRNDFLVLEASDHAGGLASSFVDEKGFTWDVGGHVQFSHYHRFDQAMEEALGPDGWLYHERRSYVWIEDTFVPYPFQNNIRYLTEASRDRCLAGLEKAARNAKNAKSAKRPKNFREWILTAFGQGIADLFLFPYNFKVWAYPPETLDYQWIGERVSVADVDRVKENIRLRRDDVSWGPNNTFRFPKFGGTGAVWRALVKKIPDGQIRFKTEVTRVDLDRREIELRSGEEISYDHLLSTIPMDELSRLTGEGALMKSARQMIYSTSNIVGVGLKGECPDHLAEKCWMYFPESNCPFYRVTLFSNYSPNNVPDIRRYWSLMTETSESNHKPVSQDRLIEDTIQGLLNTKLIQNRSQVVSTWKFRAAHGYPIPFLKRDGVLKDIQGRLMKKGVYSRGRFGAWKYEVSNQDHSFMQGVEAVNHIVSGKPEVTYNDPAFVNRGTKI
ncbi:MAG TPA: FAD-dependent oxidoreductase [Bdellovibrionota bacterium]|nr:FAD-dependent oxidoreductase [Bdellovibrionota bacterium]